MRSERKWVLCMIVGLTMLVGACANKYIIKPGDSLDTAYGKAMHFYTTKNYRDAASAFNTVLDLGRGTPKAQDAQYYLAESYFKEHDYLLAANEYKHFYTYYPQSDRVEEVRYMEAYCYYKLSPSYKLDQTNTNQAIELFQLFISRYPDSDRSTKAGKYIDEMTNKLAHKIYAAGQLYQRNDEFKASAIYFGLVFNKYPQSSWAELALEKQIEAYVLLAQNSVPNKQEQRFNEAVQTYDKFVQVFPKSKYRSDADDYYSTAKDALSKLKSQKK